MAFLRFIGGAFLFCQIAAFGAALEWEDQRGYRFAEVKPAGGKTGFRVMVPQSTGVLFTNHIPAERHYTNQILLNGSGVAAGDVDGDGWCDLFFAGLAGGSALYRNLGEWKFKRVALPLPAKLDATGAVLADLDGDGNLDLVVNSVGQGTYCFWNEGRGKFRDAPLVLNQGRCGSSLALADIDGDGALDIYIANYRTSTIRDQPGAGFTFRNLEGRPQPIAFNGRPLTEPDLTNRFVFVYMPGASGGGSVFHDELGEPDALYRNKGEGRFAKHSLQESFDWGLSVIMRDFNGDAAPDIYVCNDFATPDRFWLNDGKGQFRAPPTNAIRQTSLSTMAVDVADINRDGVDDVFTADMLSRERWRRLVQKNEANPNLHLFTDVANQPQSPRNVLQLARGDGTYAEIAQLAGLEAAEWAWTSIFLDVDLDGYEDLLVANGFERDYMNMDANRKINALKARGNTAVAEQMKLNRFYPRLATPNAAFRNLGDLRFADVSTEWGFDVRAVSQGMCLADLDNDGDLDVAINNSNDTATLLRNETSAPRVAVRLKGKAPNTKGVGARIEVLQGVIARQSQEMISGGRYLSSDDTMRVFAAKAGMTIKVTWRSGMVSMVTNVGANRVYEVEESGAVEPRTRPRTRTRTMFEEVPGFASYKGSDEARFGGGKTLPGRWPEATPLWMVEGQKSNELANVGIVNGAMLADLDGDKDDDLVLACEWGSLRVFKKNGDTFNEATTELGLARYSGWWNGVAAADFDEDGRTDLIASNFGRNTKYERYRAKPLRVVYGDFNGTGGVESMEVVYDDMLRGYAPILSVWTLAQTMPWLLEKYSSYEAFSRATVEQILGERLPKAKFLEANWLESTVFLNRGGRFEAKALPIEAQISPSFGVCVADFDGDKHQDAFLGQNLFDTRTETSRYDAGRGLLLRGDGKGGFTAVPGEESGLLIYGGQRHASAQDYDGDGRVDLVVEVDGKPRFYRNVAAKAAVE